MTPSLEYKHDFASSTVDQLLDYDMEIFKAIKRYKLMHLRGPGLMLIIERLNLEPFYEFFLNFNPSMDVPYHNAYHSACVALNCYEGAYHEQLSDEDTRGLVCGALFHDFNHSGGELSDEKNIERALSGLKTAQVFASSKLLGLTNKELAVARSVIEVTKYPYERDPQTMPEYIIRDADLMQPYEDDREELLRQYLGLKAEIEVQKKITFSAAEFAEGVKKFQDTETNWHTAWAVEKSNVLNWESRKQFLKTLLASDVLL